ncbi:MAG: class aldolase/adducin family protein [Frankiales bacterium]|nr:class aldolase/adducin family protein [Frankiales bacterium]
MSITTARSSAPPLSEYPFASDLPGTLRAAISSLFTADVMSASGHGNASVRVPDAPDHIVLTSRGLLRDLRDDEFAVVTLDGEVVAGSLQPENEEIVAMHTRVYRLRPNVGSVVHTHSPFATTYAVAGAPVPARYESLLRAGQDSDVPVAPWGPRGTAQAVDNIVDTYAAHPDAHVVLLSNHGLLATGRDARHAAQVVIALEETARLTLGAQALGGAAALPLPSGVRSGASL